MEDEKDIELQDQEQEIEGGENIENKEDPQYRGKVLMQRALDHLEKGNIEEFETDRALANKFFDEMNAEEEEMDALYNESRNFGIIYQVIESNVPTLLETKEGQKALRKIIKTIKGNKILHEQFKAYNNLQPSDKIENVDEYIAESLSLVPKFNKKAVKEANERLIKLIKKYNLDEMVDIDDEKLALAKRMGATYAINSRTEDVHEKLSEMTEGFGPDVIIEAVGSAPTYQMAVNEVAFTGRVVCIGYAKTDVSFQTKYFVQKELDIRGSRNAMPSDFRAVIRYMEQGNCPIDELISMNMTPEHATECMQKWAEAPGKVFRILIHF